MDRPLICFQLSTVKLNPMEGMEHHFKHKQIELASMNCLNLGVFQKTENKAR